VVALHAQQALVRPLEKVPAIHGSALLLGEIHHLVLEEELGTRPRFFYFFDK
jgi:hypothetical protein